VYIVCAEFAQKHFCGGWRGGSRFGEFGYSLRVGGVYRFAGGLFYACQIKSSVE
jgi:hypothetical protein